jgi:hypothetical protein
MEESRVKKAYKDQGHVFRRPIGSGEFGVRWVLEV